MLKRLFKLIAIVCLVAFVPYLAYLLLKYSYPTFVFLGDNPIYINWLLGVLVIAVIVGVGLIIRMIYEYVRYGNI